MLAITGVMTDDCHEFFNEDDAQCTANGPDIGVVIKLIIRLLECRRMMVAMTVVQRW